MLAAEDIVIAVLGYWPMVATKGTAEKYQPKGSRITPRQIIQLKNNEDY